MTPRRRIERHAAGHIDSAVAAELRRLLRLFDSDRDLLRAVLAEIPPGSPLAVRVRQALDDGEPFQR